MRWMTRFLALLLALSVGCAALQAPPPRRRTVHSQELPMYTKPTFRPVIASDAFHFESPHYVLDFDPAMATLPEYATVEQRSARGSGDLIFLEGQYDFLQQIFGIEAKDRIFIEVKPALIFQAKIGEEAIPNPRDAITLLQRSNQVIDGKIQPKYHIKMTFGIEAFNSRAVRAHELTHAFAQPYALPAWMAEGMAVLVEEEYAGGRGWAQQKQDLKPIGLDAEGKNTLQSWRGDNSDLPFRSVELYAYSYRILKELQKRYGMDLFKRFFALLEEDGIYRRMQSLSTNLVVYYLSQAAGEDLVPFFEQMHFKVRRLTQDDILSILGD